MATQIPNTNINVLTLLTNLITQLNSNFQALQTALNEKATAHRLSVSGYAATGATTTKMTLGSVSPPGSVPWAVILVRARESRNPGGDLAITTRVNFVQDGSTLYIYEPAGLTQNTQYDLDFLVLE